MDHKIYEAATKMSHIIRQGADTKETYCWSTLSLLSLVVLYTHSTPHLTQMLARMILEINVWERTVQSLTHPSCGS